MDFREFLDTHETFIDSIGDLIVTEQGNKWCSKYGQNRDRSIEYGVISKTELDPEYFNKNCVSGDEEWAIKNIRNSWYHQVVLFHPGSTEERMKIAPWKVIQFYYAILSSLSAVVRIRNSQVKSGHNKLINVFQTNFIEKSELCGEVFHPPFTMYIDKSDNVFNDCRSEEYIEWEYGRDVHASNIKECLEWTKEEREGGKTNLFHYLSFLRNWINYEDPSLFIELYGDSVKKDIDTSLRWIIRSFCTMSDCYLSEALGEKRIFNEYLNFSKKISSNLELNLDFLDDRMELINEYL